MAAVRRVAEVALRCPIQAGAVLLVSDTLDVAVVPPVSVAPTLDRLVRGRQTR